MNNLLTDLTTVLMDAFWQDEYEQAKEILEEYPEMDVNDVHDEDGDSPLHCVAVDGELEMCKYLIEVKNANVNILNHERETPLYIAAMNGHLDLCQYLHDKGAYLDTRNTEGFTPFIAAAMYHQLNVCKFLHREGAHVHVKDYHDNNALIWAASENDTELCLFLVSIGLDVNQQDTYGNTSMKYCYTNANYTLLKQFCFAGARLPDFTNIDFRLQTKADERNKIRNYLTKQSIRKSILLLICVKSIRRLGANSPIKMLNTELIRKVCETLGGRIDLG
jgi:ankyrin repeat protein